MKITKHCHEECVGNLEVAQGALLGLIVGKTLEITNCFAFPKNCDESIDEGNILNAVSTTDSLKQWILPVV